MSMHSAGLEPIPEETRQLAWRLCPKGTMIMHLRDDLGPIYQDEDFADLYPKRGREAAKPWRLALVTVLQAMEGLTDRQAAEAVRTRIDWRYALSLPLDETDLDYSVLSDFRARLVAAGAAERILEPILQLARSRGWIKAAGKVRTDSTSVLAQVRALSSLESVGESMRAALNALAEQDPNWLREHLSPDWFDRYVHRFELARFPKAESQRKRLREQVGQDVAVLLAALDREQTPKALRELAQVRLLRQIFAQHYEQQGSQVRWRDGPAVSNEQRIVSPYDTQARASRKRDLIWLGYKAHLTETCDGDPDSPHLITQVDTVPATLPDSESLEPIAQRLRARDLAPAEQYVDQGYTSGPQLVKQATLGTQIIGPVGLDTSWQQRANNGYGKEHFLIDWQEQVATCPQGQRSVGWSQRLDRDQQETVVIRFAVAPCRACPAHACCTTSAAERRLTVRPPTVQDALQARRDEQGTASFQQVYARRAGIEGTISQAVRTTRLRRTPYTGLEKTHLHHVAIASGLNLTRIVAHVQAKEHGKSTRPARPLSPFARLQNQEVA